MALKALFALNTSLRLKLEIEFNRALVFISNRQLRGRPRHESHTSSSQELEYEEYDEDLSHMNRKDLFGFNPKQDKQMSDRPERQEFYDSRRQRSSDVYERAREGLDENQSSYGRNQMRNNDNFYDRRHTNNRFDKRYENSYQNYGNNYKEFRNYGQNRDNNPNRDYNRNRNFNQIRDTFDDRSNRWERYDNKSRNNDRKQLRDYQNTKSRNRVMEFNSEDNDIYNTGNQFDTEDRKPRFSRFREQEMNETKRYKRINKTVNENAIDSQEFEVQDNGENEETERQRKFPIPYNVTLENRFEVLNQIVTPLHLKPYETQLNIKYRKNVEILQKFGRKLKLVNSSVVRDSNGLPCPLESVKPSPVIDRYRNKDEFSIWPGVDGFSKTVGFFIGQPSIHSNVVCVEPDQMIVSRESHLSIAQKFQNYLKDISEYDSCLNYGEGGNWRRFHVRSNADGQHMITAIMHPQELSQQELEAEMDRLKQYFLGDERISSLYFQSSRHTRLSNEKAPFVHLSGDRTITETMFGKKFEISVDSFFQINTSAAHVLYRNIISEVNATRDTTVLDICCGTGTLAVLMAPDVCRVIGIDSSESAISDAKKNAALNDVKNVTFIAGPVEQQLPKLIEDLYSQNIVVVANPTRGGLHSSVINVLREMNFIQKIVYVSCKPEGNAFKNFVHLCAPAGKQNRQLGSPFVPTNAVPVDLFPHTTHCELIVTFERF